MKRDLALLYLLTAWPLVLLQIIFTPPFQTPDEPHHFLRAIQIADGRIGGQRISATLAGGHIEANAQVVALAFKPLAHDLDKRLQIADLARVGTLKWGASPKLPADFDNTAIYPPTLYLPSAIAVKLGRAFGLSILETYYLSRFVLGSLGVGMAALSLMWCRKGRSFLFLLLSLPYTLSTFASVSQDAMSIAFTAIAFSGLSFYAQARRDMPPWARIGLALSLGTVVGGRLPLIPIMALPLLPTAAAPDRRSLWRRVVEGSVGALPIVLALWCAFVAKIAFRAGDGVSPFDQAAFLLGHPAAVVSVVETTLKLLGGALFREFVSVLGWWDGMQPAWYYGFIGAVLALSLLAESFSTLAGMGIRAALLVLALALAACSSVLLVMYLAWTPVGAAVIDGIQGRYFFVPVAACILALPSLKLHFDQHDQGRWSTGASLLLCVAVASVNLIAVPLTILTRFYI